MSDLQSLIDMGFPKQRAEYALNVTNNKGVEPAMEWLLAHNDEAIPKLLVETVNAAATSTGNAGNNSLGDTPGCSNNAVAKSVKCDDCGKLLKDTSEVEYHAAKTGHSNFSESTEEKKPLTEEQKKEQLAMIEEKLKQKRLEREEREKADALERERNRIRSGKDMSEARRKMEELEMQKIIEQRKREKAEEKAARDRVRAQIESDKAARRARENAATSKDEQPNTLVSSTTSTISPKSASTVGLKSAVKEYTDTRIQIRLQDGSTLTETFSVKEQLSAVRLFIQMKANIDTPFVLMTTFPRKIFTDSDYELTLEALGLVPSAVIIMTKTA